ncbi:uncharacterized protein EI97DRAFT_209859 [Westerdykella ornata]|uniref:Uncharacterized protein n=1 Tax=Westerdykella ornata TaxID=318751 RepID=A0A6A6J7P8_WESOR|nr:uncharacterized protein EI97DRAFT_209859 [Westerdykella ornata]KAF2272432.1 hypothetical protein EI97DRAFT_209859 [Westerdykella ornata]
MQRHYRHCCLYPPFSCRVSSLKCCSRLAVAVSALPYGTLALRIESQISMRYFPHSPSSRVACIAGSWCVHENADGIATEEVWMSSHQGSV